MGSFTCRYCTNDLRGNKYSNICNEEFLLTFNNSHNWQMPLMILHYVADHHYCPPEDFIDDIMDAQLIDRNCLASVGTNDSEAPKGTIKIGYLYGEKMSSEKLPEKFTEKLSAVLYQNLPKQGYKPAPHLPDFDF